MVIASRYRRGGSANGLSNNLRHVVSRGSTFITKLFFPYRMRTISDPMTGFFLVKKSLIDSKQLRPKGFKILLEILISHPRLSVIEVPLQFAKRESGTSHGTMKQGLEFVIQLAALRARSVINLFYRLPKYLQFGLIGGSVFTIGMAVLYLLVSRLHVSPLLANSVQLLITLVLNYSLNKRLTWRERTVLRAAARKFIISRVATTLLNYALFAWLIQLHLAIQTPFLHATFTINYVLANVISLIAIMTLNYVISDRWVFSTLQFRFGRLAVGSLVISAAFGLRYNPGLAIAAFLALAGGALFAQASVEVWRMLYSYREPAASDRLKFPAAGVASEQFCLIVPARHESAVLAATLRQLTQQTHPMVAIISVICDDDDQTLAVANEVAAENERVRVIEFPLQAGVKPSKPKQLNYVLELIADEGYTVIGIIDAEDSVQPELLRHVDAAFADSSVGIVQGGVQLMNYDSSWYALHNVLEYYRWFNSAMAFQADNNFMPLGGNTIFIRYEVLRAAGGWPITLTEDCSLGVLLSTRFNIKTAVYYEPWLATREETPDSLRGLFHQRVRWNQGFFNEWRKGIWHELPSFRQRLLAGYVLGGPVILAGISTFLVITLLATLFLNAPVGLVMLMYIPIIPVTLLLILNAVFLHDFGQAFDRRIRLTAYAKLFLTYFAYQTVLNAAAFWSIVRELKGETSWYKTPHTGQHRLQPAEAMADSFAIIAETGEAI